jgi:predicted nucleic acid-binding protein
MSESSFKVVCDAGPLIHLDELACIPLLDDFDEVLVPEQVWQEVAQHRPTALNHPDVVLHQINVTVSARTAFQALAKSLSLGYGEQAALTLMQAHPDAILLTDDAAARLAANTLGYQVHGTVGILIRAIRRHQNSRA